MGCRPSRVVVLGGTGMLGHEAIRSLANEFTVHASVRDPDTARRYDLPAELHAFDAQQPDTLADLLNETQAEVAINCIGIVKQLEIASEAVPTITTNSLFPHQLAAACARAGVRLVHVSTDCVFSGSLAPPGRYTESDIPDPTDLYGRSKLLGEVDQGEALTLRTSIIGWELDRATGLLEWLSSQAGERVKGFAHAHFSGLTTRALSAVIGAVLIDQPELRGLYHVSSAPISKYDLLRAFDEALGLGCKIERVEEPQINRALDSSRFTAETGIEIPGWDAMIDDYGRVAGQ